MDVYSRKHIRIRDNVILICNKLLSEPGRQVLFCTGGREEIERIVIAVAQLSGVSCRISDSHFVRRLRPDARRARIRYDLLAGRDQTDMLTDQEWELIKTPKYILRPGSVILYMPLEYMTLVKHHLMFCLQLNGLCEIVTNYLFRQSIN